jgi:hypothetical protein
VSSKVSHLSKKKKVSLCFHSIKKKKPRLMANFRKPVSSIFMLKDLELYLARVDDIEEFLYSLYIICAIHFLGSASVCIKVGLEIASLPVMVCLLMRVRH